MWVLKMECTYKCFYMAGIRKVQLWMFVSIGVCPMADIRFPIPWHNGREGFVCPVAVFTEVLWWEDEWQPLPPNGRFVEGFHDCSDMSSITGPSLGFKPPRMILPMEVITVSRYTSPMVSSCTTWLELTLKRLGLDTIPMDIVPTGISWSSSRSPGVVKQAATPVKPRGSVGGLTNASALAGGGDNGAFGGLDGGLMEIVWVNWRALLFVLGIAIGWEIFPAATAGWDGCTTMSHPAYFGAAFGIGGASGVSVVPGASVVAVVGTEGLLPSSLGRSIPQKTSLSVKER